MVFKQESAQTANYQAIRRHRSTEQGGRLGFKQRESLLREIRNTFESIFLFSTLQHLRQSK